MTPEPGIWNKLTRIVIFLICVAGVLLLVRQYLPVIQQNERMRKQIHQLEAQLEIERETGKKLQERIDHLIQNPDALARTIRSTLNYSKSNETIFRFEGTATNRP